MILGAVGMSQVPPQQNQEERPADSANLSRFDRHQADHGGHGQHRCIPPEGLRIGRNRHDQRGDPKDQQAVGNVAADDIANGDAGRTLQRSSQAGDQLGHRGAETDQDQAGEQG